jgi:hypothetical protein
MVIKNSGNEIAKRVQADVVEIYYKNKLKINYVPVPLRWTHINVENREILPNQTVYLDVLEEHYVGKINSKIQTLITLGSSFGQEVKDFSIIDEGTNKLKIRLFEENGNNIDLILLIKYQDSLIDVRLEGKKWYWAELNKS